MPGQQQNTTIPTMHLTVMQSYIILNVAVKTWTVWLSSALRVSTDDITLLPLKHLTMHEKTNSLLHVRDLQWNLALRIFHSTHTEML